jgi:hypothetical protein
MKRPVNSISPLKLNMQMFLDEFMNRGYDPVFYTCQQDRMKLDTVMIYYGQQNLEEHIVYVCEDQMLREHPVNNQDICFFLCNEKEPATEDCRPSTLIFYHVKLPIILNTAAEILRSYHEFEKDLYAALDTGGLNTLCDIAVRFFKNPMQIHDEKFILLSRPQSVQGMSEVVHDESTGITSFQLTLINALKNNSDYIKTLSTRGAHLWIQYSMTAFRVLYINLFDSSDQYLGRVLVNEINSIFYPSHFQLLEYFAQFVLLAILKKSNIPEKTSVTFENFLQKFLRGEVPSRESALWAIGLQNWEEHDHYICVNVLVRKTSEQISDINIAQLALLLRFGTGKIFQENGSLWMLFNLTHSHMTESDFRNQIYEFARDGAYTVGLSSFFHNFFRFPDACRQAEIAVQYAGSQDVPIQLYFFEEAIVPYMMSKITDGESINALCHEKLLALLENDIQKGTDYYLTLQTYIENERNLTNVANALHIHRSTLQYRIEKIQELIDLPLEDAETRFYLQCCFRMLPQT